MREILFRGKDDSNGKWIFGYLVDAKHIGDWVTSNPVCPETVGQFTGVTDKKGVKIFEGDIVNGYDAVGFLKGSDVVSWDTIFSGWRFGKNTLYGSKYISKYEVVGNIHDNPELLEVRCKDGW